MVTTKTNLPSALALGKTLTVFNESPSTGGSQSVKFAIESENLLLSLFVESITGTLDIVAYTMAGDDANNVAIITIPTISAPTPALVLQKAPVSMGYVMVEATYTGACTFVLKARGLSVGETSVKILGQNAAKNYATEIDTTPSLIIPIALAARTGLAFHNTDATKTIYMGFTLGTTTTVDGWEIAPGEKLGLDVATGVAIFGMVTSGTAILKVLEAGS